MKFSIMLNIYCVISNSLFSRNVLIWSLWISRGLTSCRLHPVRNQQHKQKKPYKVKSKVLKYFGKCIYFKVCISHEQSSSSCEGTYLLTVIGRIIVVKVLTCNALLHSGCDSKAAQMNRYTGILSYILESINKTILTKF